MTEYATWETLELPLLQEIWQAEVDDREPRIREFFSERGVSDRRAERVIESLRDAGLIDGIFSRGMGSPRLPQMANVHLAPEGRRAVGVWPSGDAAEAFARALEAAIEQAQKPEDRTRLEVLRDAFNGVPGGVVTQLAAAALMRATGLG